MPGIEETANGRALFYDETLALREDYTGSDKQRRNFDRFVDGYGAKLNRVMQETYESEAERTTRAAETVTRISTEFASVLDEIVDDLDNGRISAKDAAAQIGGAKRDLNKLAKELSAASESEERAWSQVNVTPGEFQRQIAKRFPALMKPGRGLPVLTEAVLDGREEPKF